MVKIGDQTYREVDNGQANVLVPVEDPLNTRAELAAKRRALERALFQAGHPMGTIFSGIAETAGGSRGVQDATLAAGAWVDEAAPGGVSRGRIKRPGPIAAQDPINFTRDRIVLREPNATNQATGGSATVIPEVLGTGTKASRKIKPVGHVSGSAPWNHDRSHLIASWFGGPGSEGANLMVLERRANQVHMKGVEADVARRVRNGETIEYSVAPLYAEDHSPPSMVLMTASGHREGARARLVRNPVRVSP